jgi:hypothetical protein
MRFDWASRRRRRRIALEEEHAKDRAETAIVEDMVCAISEERDSFFEDRTDAQNCCWFDNKCLVFGESMFDPIILEHYPICRKPGVFRSSPE